MAVETVFTWINQPPWIPACAGKAERFDLALFPIPKHLLGERDAILANLLGRDRT